MPDSNRIDYDYIIVGAGSAGCVLAYHLSADPDVRVLVLEAGPPDKSIFIHMPAALAHPLANDRFNWYYHSEPEPYMNDRRMYCPRGRVIGGSSSINGMAYVRGHARDYDRWATSSNGLAHWSYAHCLPYFRRAESYDQRADDYRGDSGPLRVSRGRMDNPLFKAWIEAGQQAGYPWTPDMNGHQQEGVGAMDMTVADGERWSAAKAYLRPAMQRPNLRVETRALTTRVRFEGQRAVGVDYAQGGDVVQVRATREVILCGGAINSPQLLMLSGIGPAEALRTHGLEVKADLPGVGSNLQDHLEIYVQHGCTKPVSLYSATRPLNKLRIGVQWLLFRSGPGATSHFEGGGFIRSRAGVEHPDLQYHFLPIAMNYDGSERVDQHGFQAHVGPMRPTSRGHVRLRSADPRDPPLILFNYMQTEQDRQEMRDAVRLTREIIAQSAFDELRGPELAPGPGVQSDAEIDAFIRSKAESAYHPSCTCAMGTGPNAVVDGDGRVHGIDGLRVVDASIMPTVASGNLNAPTIMLAEKLADAIVGREALAPAHVPVWINPDWQTAQR